MQGIQRWISERKIDPFILGIVLGIGIVIALSWLAAFQPKFGISWSDFVFGLAGLGAIAATIVALRLFRKTAQEVAISQQQVIASQEQTRSLLRPILYP